MKIEYYTDGSCRNNGQANNHGAYGYLKRFNNETIWTEIWTEDNTTNQRCELKGVLEACKNARELRDTFCEVIIYTDSAYIVNCYKQKWYDKWQVNNWKNSKSAPVANQDLWEELIPYFDSANFNFVKVKGHAGVEFNEAIDNAVQAASLGRTW